MTDCSTTQMTYCIQLHNNFLTEIHKENIFIQIKTIT